MAKTGSFAYKRRPLTVNKEFRATSSTPRHAPTVTQSPLRVSGGSDASTRRVGGAAITRSPLIKQQQRARARDNGVDLDARLTTTLRPRQHQRPIQTRTKPVATLNSIARARNQLAQSPTTTTIGRFGPFPRRQQPQPLSVAANPPAVAQQRPQSTASSALQTPLVFKQQPQRFVPIGPDLVRIVADLAADTWRYFQRDPTVIGYLRDLEDYDWNYNNDAARPDLQRPARELLRQEVSGEFAFWLRTILYNYVRLDVDCLVGGCTATTGAAESWRNCAILDVVWKAMRRQTATNGGVAQRDVACKSTS